MVDPEELGHIRTALRGFLEARHQGPGGLPTLNRVVTEMNQYHERVDIAWRLNDGSEFTVFHHVRRYFRGAPLDLMRPVERALIEMYREIFIELTDNPEAYVPDPEYRYAIIDREPRIYGDARLMMNAEEMVMRTTRDPYHAGQRDRGHRAREEEAARHRWEMERRRWELERLARQQNVGQRLDMMHAQMQQISGIGMGVLGQQTNAAQQAPAFTLDMLRQAQNALAGNEARNADFAAAHARSLAAEAKGWELLLSNLTPEQKSDLESKEYFWVIGGATGIHYQLRKGRSHNIRPHTAKKGWTGVRYTDQGCSICFMPNGDLCIGDVMLTQKVALELREADALKTANFSGPIDWLKKANPEIWHAITSAIRMRYGNRYY